MDNTINSLVSSFATNAGNTSSGMVKDYQGKTYDPNTILALSRQVAASIDPNAIKGGVFSTKGESVGFNYDEATKLLGHPPTAAEQVILDMSRHLANEGVTDLNQVDASDTNRRFGSTYTGGGGTIYEIKKDASGKPVISSWSKNTSDKKTILTGLAIAATVFGIPGVTEGLLGSAPAGTTLGTVGAETAGSTAFELANAGVGAFEGGTALNSLAAMTPAELAQFEAMNAGATAMTDLGASELANAGATALSDLGASELANAGASANAASNVANAANTASTAANAANAASTAANTANAANVAKTLIDPITGLAISAAGNVLGNVANQQGIDAARTAITQGGATANTALNNAYTNAQALNAAGRTDLGNVYANTNKWLGDTLNAQAGVYDKTGTTLANNYQNLGTTLKGNLADQVAAYNAANQGINTNAQNQLGLLSKTYEGQKAQAAANAAALNQNYNTTLGKMGDVYNQQVGFQQPYQDVGRAGSQGLIDNQGYLTRQFGAADLNSQLAPNYAFQLQQGQMANQRAANMGGGSLGGNALRGLQDYTQNYAAGAYQNAFNNFNTQRQNIYSTLAGMANIGTTSGGQLASLGNTYGSNMGSLSSNLGQMQNAYNQYGSNVTGASNAYGSNVLGNANQMQGAYNQYGSNLANTATNYANNLTTNTNTGVNASNVYGLNSANLAIGQANALANNATATGANNATALNNLANTALLGSMIKAT